jgi:hypothetical protein
MNVHDNFLVCSPLWPILPNIDIVAAGVLFPERSAPNYRIVIVDYFPVKIQRDAMLREKIYLDLIVLTQVCRENG